MLCLKNIKGQNNTELLSNQKKKEKKDLHRNGVMNGLAREYLLADIRFCQNQG